MMRRWELWAGLGLAVVVALWWVQRDASVDLGGRGAVRVAPTDSAHEVVAAAPPVKTGGSPAERSRADGPATSLGPATDDSLAEPAEPWAPKCHVTVVAAETLRPVPQAELWWLDEEALTAEERVLVDDSSWSWNLVTERGTRLELDGNGAAYVPVDDAGRVRAFAREGNRQDWCDVEVWPRRGQSVVLTLRTVPALRVEVVDGVGRPVGGIPVVCMWYQHSFFSSSLPAAEVVDRSVTDQADGVATFEFLPDAMQHHDSMGAHANESGWFIALDMPGVATVSCLPIDPRDPRPVRLSLPEFASLAVSLEGPEGEPWPSGATLQLSAEAQNLWMNAAGVDVVTPPPFERSTYGDSFVWPCVGSEVPLTLTATAEGFEPVVVDIPTLTPREQRVVTVRFDAASPRWVGRAVDGEGRALAETRLLWSRTRLTQEIPGHWKNGEVITDADGRFDISHAPSDEAERLWFGRVEGPSVRFSACRAITSVDVDRTDEPVVDLGTVTLTDAPVLAEGRAVDAFGFPVEGGAVWVERTNGHGNRVHETETDGDGCFIVRGTTAQWDGLVHVESAGLVARLDDTWAPSWVGTPEEAQPAVLARCGLLRGRWLAHPWLEPRNVVVDVGDRALYSFERSAGLWTLRGPPGEVTLRVQLLPSGLGSRGLLAADKRVTLIEEIVHIPETHDDTLGPTLDVRRSVWVHVVVVTDQHGQPLPNAWVSFEDGSRTEGDLRGRVVLMKPEPASSFHVGGAHHRSIAISPHQDETSVQLEGGLPVELVFSGGEVQQLWMLDGTSYVDCEHIAEDRFRVGAPGAGSFTLQATVSGSPRSRTVTGTLEVVETPELQEVTFFIGEELERQR